jgi:protein TonB
VDYVRMQRNPSRHLVGIGGVILLHILIVYAMVTGLARKVVDVVKGPIEVKVIEEIVQKPPPPPELLPPPPKLAAPPPPFIPPPEISIAPPPTPAPTITVVTQEAPPAPQAPVIAKPVETAPPAPAPAIQAAQVVCPNYQQVVPNMPYPREALLDGIEGEVVIEFTVASNGRIRDVVIKSSTNRVFNRDSLRAISSLKCEGQARDIRVQAPLSFKIK